jgi:alkylation response protein AidB-like acyl-CoA dehydrogenase
MRDILEDTIERLFGDHCTTAQVHGWEGGQWPEGLWAELEATGFTLASAPEALGGAGASWADLYGVVCAAGRHAAPVPLGEALLANWLLGQAGLEPFAGPLTIATCGSLRLLGGELTGQLPKVPWGRYAHGVVAVAVDERGALHVVLVPPTVGHLSPALNLAGEPRDHLRFEAARPLTHAPLPDALGADPLTHGAALLRSAQIAGALQAVLGMTVEYAGTRQQFGRPITAFQAIGQQLAVLAEQSAAAGIAAQAAFEASDQGLSAFNIAVAKVTCGEAAGTVASIAHGVHGAIGFTEEYALQLLTRRLWAWRSEYGSAGHWSRLLGQLLCRGGASGYWPAVTQPPRLTSLEPLS